MSGKSMTKDAALDHSSHCDVCVRPSCRKNLSCVFYAINSPLRDGLSLSLCSLFAILASVDEAAKKARKNSEGREGGKGPDQTAPLTL